MSSNTLNLVVTVSPSAEEIDYLTERINEESKCLNIEEEAYSFGIFIRRKDYPGILLEENENTSLQESGEEIIAGCNGSVVYGAIYTDQLWVHKKFRGKGLGRLLMEKVEQFGISKKCSMATVGTMSFQGASTFYEKMGYIEDFRRDGYTQGSSILSYKKMLKTSS